MVINNRNGFHIVRFVNEIRNFYSSNVWNDGYVVLVVLCLIPLPVNAFQYEESLKDPAQEALAKEIFVEVRCVKCSGQSIADSDVDIARDLRYAIRDKIKNGKSKDEVLAYLVEKYGNAVLFRPPLKKDTIFLWFAPFGFLFLGIVVIWFFLKKK